MIRRNALAFAIFILTGLFVVAGLAFGGKLKVAFMTSGDMPGSTAPADTPTTAVQRIYENVQRRNMDAAYKYVSNQEDLAADTFNRELAGADGNLKSLASLNDFQVHLMTKKDNTAKVRADLQWSTPVGAFFESREFDVTQAKDNSWKVVWPVDHAPKLTPQVVPVTYQRWDMTSGKTSDYTPKVRIVSQNAVQDADNFYIVGEVLNEDTVPALIAVNATLVGVNGDNVGQESSFDNVVHTLMPNEKTPFRIDFPETERSKIKNIKLNVSSNVLPTAGAPVIQVQNARIESIGGSGGEGKKVLRGEIVNSTGEVDNIPHLLAAFYDAQGKVVWVANTYLDHALLPQIPLSFSMPVPAAVANSVQSYKVVVNSYSVDQT
jgi:hypothetical protein